MDLRFKKLLALLLTVPVYLTLLHTHEPEALREKGEIYRYVHAVHSPDNHHSDDGHRNDENKHSQKYCLICLIVSSVGPAAEISIGIEPEITSDTVVYYLDKINISNIFTSYFQRRGPPASVVL